MSPPSAAQVSIRQAKRSLRREMKAVLSSLDPSNVSSQSNQVLLQVLQHPAFTRAQNVSIYVSMDAGEVKTESLCQKALELGKSLYVPRFAAKDTSFDQDMRMLRVNNWQDFQDMVLNKWGIREPAEEYRTTRRQDALEKSTGGSGLDLILAPGVAFDTRGGRLGHGKGYYDRYVSQAKQFAKEHNGQMPITIALALEEQVLHPPSRVPTDANDLPLDDILSAHGSIIQHENEG